MSDKNQRFEALLLPHLDAAYNLARWLLRDEHWAQDVVQDAYLRAFRGFETLRGDAARPWLLGIVRNACFDHLRQRGRDPARPDTPIDDADGDENGRFGHDPTTPERLLLDKVDAACIDAAIADLAPIFREVIVLRELEGLRYEEIAALTGTPLGTVMSRLARARAQLRRALSPLREES